MKIARNVLLFLGFPIGFLIAHIWENGYRGGAIALAAIYVTVYVLTCIMYRKDP